MITPTEIVWYMFAVLFLVLNERLCVQQFIAVYVYLFNKQTLR